MIRSVNTIDELTSQLQSQFGSQESLLDIGCGIRPFHWLKCDQITCIEPFDPYREILISTYGMESLVALKGDFISVTEIVDIRQFSAVTLIDVIEHLPKNTGLEGLQKIIDSGVELFFVFTPNGFMPQHTEGIDAWGLSSGSQQDHLSGWTIEDFSKLGFKDFWLVDSLHHEDGKTWDGLLAILDRRPIRKSGLAVWDPEEAPNTPPDECGTVIVLGRHNRNSGTVKGTHRKSFDRKVYIPALSFAPPLIRKIYKFFVSSIISILNTLIYPRR